MWLRCAARGGPATGFLARSWRSFRPGKQRKLLPAALPRPQACFFRPRDRIKGKLHLIHSLSALLDSADSIRRTWQPTNRHQNRAGCRRQQEPAKRRAGPRVSAQSTRRWPVAGITNLGGGILSTLPIRPKEYLKRAG